MKRFTYALAFLALAGLGIAQTPASHTVTVNVPSVLQVSVDAVDVLFDFSDPNLGTQTLTVGSTQYPRASYDNYTAFLDSGNTSQVFAPTRVDLIGGSTADFVTLTVLSNRAQWTVSVAPASGSALAAPLDNTRIQVFAEKISGKGNALTQTPASLPSTGSVDLAQATLGGQGKSRYKVYHLLQTDLSDDIPISGYTGTVTLVYTIASP